MKRSIYVLMMLLFVACSAGFLVACGDDGGGTETTVATAEQPEKSVVLRLSAPHPAGDPVTEEFQKEFADKFNAQAGGKYTIEIHPNASLVSVPDSFEGVKAGAVEMGEWAIAVFGSVDPLFNMAELPFSVNSIEADAAYTQQMQKVYDQVCQEKYNMKCVLAFTCQGLDIISTEPVKTLDDWDGLLCQTISPPTAKVVDLLGGAGVAMDFAEGYQAMQKGVIEASPQSGSMIIMFKMNEVAKHLTRAYLTPASIALFMNLDAYNKMPEDIKVIFDKCAADAQTAINNHMIEFYKTNYAKIAEMGIEVYPLPSAERDKWAEKCQPYSDELLGAVDPALADQVKKITADLDTQFPYQD
ncbi:MAG: TRAP transporter substrate-binding protein [Thermoleophilia bacterium]|nr:TRAP transporter substrate-binding protein [Thermoleophilia bacterium]